MELFSTDLTEKEVKYGFIVADVQNPNARYLGQPKKVKAVVRILSQTTRITKHPYPPDSIMYSVQEKTTGYAGREVWKTTAGLFPSIETLIPAGFL